MTASRRPYSKRTATGDTVVSEAANRCPFCMSTHTVAVHSYHSPIDKQTYALRACADCGIEFFWPRTFTDVYETEAIGMYKEFHAGGRDHPPWTRELAKQLQHYRPLLRTAKIVDIGAGDAINFEVLEKFGVSPEQYWAIEFDEKSNAVSRGRGVKHIIPSFFDARIAGRFTETFDIALITEVLEHQTHPKQFMENVRSVVKPGGLIIITVPNRKRFFLAKRDIPGDIPPHHFLRFDKKFFEKNFDAILVRDYSFNSTRNARDSSVALSNSLFNTPRAAPLTLPIIPVLRTLDNIKGEGLFVIVRNGQKQRKGTKR